MTDKLLEQIKADQEAGTPGPWDWEGGNGPTNPHATANLGVWSEPLYEDALNDDDCDEPDDEKWVCGIWGDIDGSDCANARRIARVPDMEARVLADAEVIEAAEKLAEQCGFWGLAEGLPCDVKNALTAFREAMKKREEG